VMGATAWPHVEAVSERRPAKGAINDSCHRVPQRTTPDVKAGA
jgi:hypothetical protein